MILALCSNVFHFGLCFCPKTQIDLEHIERLKIFSTFNPTNSSPYMIHHILYDSSFVRNKLTMYLSLADV